MTICFPASQTAFYDQPSHALLVTLTCVSNTSHVVLITHLHAKHISHCASTLNIFEIFLVRTRTPLIHASVLKVDHGSRSRALIPLKPFPEVRRQFFMPRKCKHPQAMSITFLHEMPNTTAPYPSPNFTTTSDALICPSSPWHP